jgi:hypothetical protein
MDVVRQQVTADELLLMPDDGFRYELVKGELRRMNLNGQTGNYQAVTIQGQLTYRIVEPLAGKKAVAPVRQGFRFAWDAPRLCFSVREPFVSKASAAGIVWGNIRAGEKLEVVSQMPQNGVIFSDGVEADYLAIDSGAVASISVAEEKARLVAA